MIYKIGKTLILVLMVLNGLLFVSNIYVIGDIQAIIAMHDDLAPSSSPLLANTKVIVCFITGLLYLASAIGIMKKKHLSGILGFAGFLLFDGLYLYQLVIHAAIHPRIWIDFGIFGTLSLIIGLFSFRYWTNRKSPAEI